MADNTATSKISPVTIFTGNSQQRRAKKGPSKKIYIKTRIKKVNDVNGEPRFQFEIIEFKDGTGKGAEAVIAKGNTYLNDKRGEDGNFILGGDDSEKSAIAATAENSINFGGSFQRSLITKGLEKPDGLLYNAIKEQVKTDTSIKALAKTSLEKQSQAAIDKANTDSNTENSDDDPVSTSDFEFGEIGDSPETRQNYNLNLKYPETIDTDIQDTLKIDVFKFSPSKVDGLSFKRSKFKDGGTRTSIGSVILPVSKVADKNSVGWGGESMNAFDVAFAGAAMAAIEGGADAFADRAKSTIDSLGNEIGGLKKSASVFFTQAATGTTGLLARTAGAIVNPNFELLFNGPKLRTFAFTYRMSPRSKDETLMVMRIIRMFKQSMAVQRSVSNLFLKAPNTYQLVFRKAKSEKHDFLPKIKECALTSFNVNYTPDGTYSTFENSSMTSYELQFQFSELEPLYNDDYGNKQNALDTSIGF